MQYIPSVIQAQPGLFQALALQTTTIDGAHARAQRNALRQTPYLNGPVQPGPPAPLPATYEPTPHSLAWEHNLKRFLEVLAWPGCTSPNPYNDHSAFAHAPILAAGWMLAPEHWQVAPGRYRYDRPNLVQQFEQVFAACGGFNERFPVLLDRQGRVLDGECRLQALARLNEMPGANWRVYCLQLDF